MIQALSALATAFAVIHLQATTPAAVLVVDALAIHRYPRTPSPSASINRPSSHTSIRTPPVFLAMSDAASASASASAASDTHTWRAPSKDVLNHVLAVAKEAATRAGEIIVGNGGGAEVTERKANSRDLLTLVDPMCERTIRETVLQAFPDHAFLGEEDVLPGKEASAAALETKLLASGTSDWLWIVDPIDGTTNFVHGMPLCMPSVAAAYKGVVVVGVIWDPHRKEMFSATLGGGAHLNGEAIHVGGQEGIGDAVVAMGSPPAEESMAMSLRGVAALMPEVRTIRMLGSAALMLAWVANGRLTAYWEYDLSSWDVAAGSLLVREAGGRFTDLAGNESTLRTRKICASNGLVHDDLLRLLNDAGVV
jgi:myo-inositol-1(or 4)-monophosphatase